MTFKLAETSVVKSRLSVSYGANLLLLFDFILLSSYVDLDLDFDLCASCMKLCRPTVTVTR